MVVVVVAVVVNADVKDAACDANSAIKKNAVVMVRVSFIRVQRQVVLVQTQHHLSS